MHQTIVLYQSHYGSTKRYAQWIAKALSCPACESKKFPAQDLADYDTVVFGGGLYAGGVNGVKFIRRNWKLLSDKRVVLFTCGLADPDNPKNAANIRDSLSKALSEEILSRLQLFHLRGDMDYSRLNFTHRSMMAMLRKMLLKKEADGSLSPEDRMLLDTYGKSLDFTDEKTIQPLVAFIQSSHP